MASLQGGENQSLSTAWTKGEVRTRGAEGLHTWPSLGGGNHTPGNLFSTEDEASGRSGTVVLEGLRGFSQGGQGSARGRGKRCPQQDSKPKPSRRPGTRSASPWVTWPRRAVSRALLGLRTPWESDEAKINLSPRESQASTAWHPETEAQGLLKASHRSPRGSAARAGVSPRTAQHRATHFPPTFPLNLR